MTATEPSTVVFVELTTIQLWIKLVTEVTELWHRQFQGGRVDSDGVLTHQWESSPPGQLQFPSSELSLWVTLHLQPWLL